MEQKLDDAIPQGLSNLLWALASLQFYDAPLVDRMLVRAVTCLDDFTSQGIANVLWALATMNHSNRQHFDAFLAAALRFRMKLNPQELSNTLWAVAAFVSKTLNPNSSIEDGAALIKAAMDQTTSQVVPGPRPVAPRNLSPALANGSWYTEEVDLLLEPVFGQVQAFTSQGMANIIWSLATIGHPNRPAFVALVDAAVQRRHMLNAQGLSIILWAMAMQQTR